MKTAFLYSDKFGDFSYGSGHPMRPERLRLTFELIRSLDILSSPEATLIEARPATNEELLTSHTKEYLEILKEADSGVAPDGGAAFGLGAGDNPVFPGVFEWSSYSAGASIDAAKLVASGEYDAAFNISGGLHHAMRGRASGFCYINDPVVAINYLLSLDLRVAYIDIDAHHGDGVERAFYDIDRVLTISIHESGQYLFPGTGFPRDMGEGEGLGYSVNLPLPPGAGDEIFLSGFRAIVPEFIEAFAPDILVAQLGVDTFATDPITHLTLTTNGFEEMIRVFKSLDIPLLALGGGGYELSNVARAWTLAFAEICNVDIPDPLVEPFVSPSLGIRIERLRDARVSLVAGAPDGASYEGELKRDIEFLRSNQLKKILSRSGS